MVDVTVLGAGAWGTTFGQVLADAGNDVTMWAIEPEIVADINENHRNSTRLPVVDRLPDAIRATGDRAEAVKGARIVVVTIAAQAARGALEGFRGLIPDDAVVVSLMKGIERTTNKRMDEVVCEALGLEDERFACLSGPNLSKQVAQRQPAAALIASRPQPAAALVAEACSTSYFRPFISSDVVGVELCGALKNVTALAVGMVKGAGFGENTAAMVVTRGLAELRELGLAAGADERTFSGLAGIGDLIATCSSPLSRNFTFGANLGRGMSVEEAEKASNGVAEGVATTAAAVRLGRLYGVAMPLANAVSRVLSEGVSCREMLSDMIDENVTAE